MPRLQVGTRKQIFILRWRGYSIQDIHHRLNEEGTEISVRNLQRLCMKFEKMHIIQDLPRKPRPQLLTEEMLSAMDQILREDDEATARRLRAMLCEKFASFPEVSLGTIKRLDQFFAFCITCCLCEGVTRKSGGEAYLRYCIFTKQPILNISS